MVSSVSRGVCFSLFYLQTLALSFLDISYGSPRAPSELCPKWTHHVPHFTPLHPSSAPLSACNQLSGNLQQDLPLPTTLPILVLWASTSSAFLFLDYAMSLPTSESVHLWSSLPERYLLQVYLWLAPSHLSGLCSNLTAWERSSLTTQVSCLPFSHTLFHSSHYYLFKHFVNFLYWPSPFIRMLTLWGEAPSLLFTIICTGHETMPGIQDTLNMHLLNKWIVSVELLGNFLSLPLLHSVQMIHPVLSSAFINNF